MHIEAARDVIAKATRSFQMSDGTLVLHTLVRLEELEDEPFWRQYVLNPTVSADDVLFVVGAFFVISTLRLAISGGTTGRLRRVPCVSKQAAKTFYCVRLGKLHKFSENSWYALWHTAACALGILVLLDEAGTPETPGWPRMHLMNPDGRWYWMASAAEVARGSSGWPLLLPTRNMRTYYLMQLGFWLSCIAFINVETRRKDYWVLLVHHAVTIALVGFSYCCSYWKVGLVILVLHDSADVFLYLSKALHYSNIHSRAVELSFATFVVVYFFTRLVIFPIYGLLPCLNIGLIRELTQDSVRSHWRIPGGTALPACLIVLLILHVYWFGCICRMVVGLIQAIHKGSRQCCEDIRSEDEMSEAAEETPEKSKGQ